MKTKASATARKLSSGPNVPHFKKKLSGEILRAGPIKPFTPPANRPGPGGSFCRNPSGRNN